MDVDDVVDTTDRSQLRQCGERLLSLMINHSSENQWAQWLRVLLEHALFEGDVALAKVLLQSGADAGSGSYGLCDDATLLHAAALGGGKGAVQLILDAGCEADVDVRNSDGHTPLDLLVMNPDPDLHAIVLLASDGQSINESNSQGQTPLLLASWKGSERAVTLLLELGAEPNVEDIRGVMPLHRAVQREDFNLAVKALLDTNAQYNLRVYSLLGKGDTPLEAAARCNNITAMEELLIRGASMEVDGMTALHAAAEHGGGEAVDLLIKSGADVRARDRAHQTPLHLATCNPKCMEIIPLLLLAGVDVDAQDRCSRTPLQLAAQKQASLHCIPCLVRAGANINTRNRRGETPLRDACERVDDEMVSILLRYGADGKAEDRSVYRRIPRPEVSTPKIEAKLNNIYDIFKHLPAHRAWWRRGWLVMLRHRELNSAAMPRDGVVEGETTVAEVEVDRQSRHAHAESEADTDESASQSTKKTREEDEDEAVHSGASMSTGDCETRRLREAVTRIVSLEEEGVFRAVVSFL